MVMKDWRANIEKVKVNGEGTKEVAKFKCFRMMISADGEYGGKS